MLIININRISLIAREVNYFLCSLAIFVSFSRNYLFMTFVHFPTWCKISLSSPAVLGVFPSLYFAM